ncbi:MAG: DUF3164 family protein [Bacteroidales bacterium]|nr:DUF3164 family protein [Bacteroidales bacterium]
MIQKVKDKEWTDETGRVVPIDYISPGNRLKERSAGTLHRKAKSINEKLVDFKAEVQEICDKVYKKMIEEFKAKPDGKGNFTWFNFDRSIKIDVTVNPRIEFDDLTIQACKQKLDEFLNENLDSKQEFVKEMVKDAFSTSRGKLDNKKVMNLLKWRTKVKDPLFQAALDLIEDSIRNPSSKVYFRIWEQDKSGEYKLIDLNFSSI